MTLVDSGKAGEGVPTVDASTVWDLFVRRAGTQPGAVAVQDGAEVVTYGDLVQRAGELAARLRRGGGVEPLTAVCLPRSASLVVAMLASLKQGGYLPLDPDAPAGHLRHVLTAGAPNTLLCRDDLDLAVPGGVARIDPDSGAAASGSSRIASPGELAYVIYTSGSTGAPKGVAVEHESLLRHLLAFGRRFEITPADRALLFASATTDVSIEQVLVPLAHGATVVLNPPGLIDTPDEFFDFVKRECLTVVNVPAGYWRVLTKESAPETSCPDLRLMISGSDIMPADHAREWTAGPLGTAALVNAYGPTETVITASTQLVTAAQAGKAGTSVPLGAPLPDRDMRVLDADLRPVEPGAGGEIYVAGELARGYFGDPRRTAAAFVPDPSRAGGRLYRTGDAGWVTSDGSIEFAGRVDRQVKVRGFRVELGAVEAAALSAPGVADSVAVLDDSADEARLALLVVPAESHLDLDELRTVLNDTLPSHSTPGTIRPVDALPLTAGGKVDHAAARAMVQCTDAAAQGEEPPVDEATSELERALLGLWRDAFSTSTVGPEDDFVSLGGDSMTSLAIACQAPSLDLKLRPRDIFEARTVRELARRLSGHVDDTGDTGTQSPSAQAADASGATDSGEPTPGTLWLADRLGTIPRCWSQYVLLELREDVDKSTLHAAFDTVLRQYPLLYSPLEPRDAAWRHVSTASLRQDYWSEEEAGSDDDVMGEIRDRAGQWIDPAAGRMIRVTWIHDGGKAARLLLVAHHTVIDAVSWQLLLAKLESAYQLKRDRWGVPAAQTVNAATRWSAAVRSAVAAGRFDDEISLWADTVDIANRVTGVHATAGVEGATRSVSVTVDGATEPAAASDPAHATLPERVVAATMSAWRTHTARDVCILEMESTGRDVLSESGAFETVGWLTAMYPIVLEIADNDSDTLAWVRDRLRGVPSTGVGYGALRHYHPDRSVRERLRMNRAPDVAFNFLGQVQPPPHGALLQPDRVPAAGPLRDPAATRPSPLVVDGRVHGKTLVVTFEFDGQRVTEVEARVFADEFENHLRMPPAGASETEFPLTPAQEGMLFHAAASRNSDAYVGQAAVELSGVVQHEQFVSAWQATAEATPPLRTYFSWRRQGTPTQRVIAAAEILPVSLHDWRSRQESAENLVDELLAAEREKPFDLEVAPLFRVALAQLTDEQHICVLTHHHLILDGWSMNALLEDFGQAYAALVQGEAAALQQRPSAARLVATSDEKSGSDQFWQDLLRGMRQTSLVSDGRVRSGLHEETSQVVPSADWSRLTETARSGGMTPAVLVHLAWGLYLRDCLKQDEVTFGTVMSGRDQEIADIERVSGMLINTLPFRLRMRLDEKLADCRQQATSMLLGIQERQHASLVHVRQQAGLERKDVLFDHLLDFGGRATMVGTSQRDAVASVGIHPLRSVERTNYGVTVTAWAGSELELSINHDTGLLAAEEARSALTRLRGLLEVLAGADGESSVGALLAAPASGEGAR